VKNLRKPSWLTHKFNIFSKTFIILIVFSIIPVLIANSIIHQKSIAAIQKYVYITNLNMLEKTSKTVDLILKQIDQTAEQLAKEKSIINYIVNPNVNLTTRNTSIINNLKNISLSYDYIASVDVFAAFNNTVLRPGGYSYRLDQQKDHDWLDFYNKSPLGTGEIGPHKVVAALGKEKYYLTLLRNLPFGSSSKLGAIVINIDEEKLYETIVGSDIETKGKIYVLNQNGFILSHQNKNMLYRNISGDPYIGHILTGDKGHFMAKIHGKPTLVNYVTSSYNHWKYIFTVSMIDWHRESKVVSTIIILITLGYVLFGLFFAFLVSKGIYNPVKKLVNMVLTSSKANLAQSTSVIRNEYEFLGNAYTDVIDRNKSMEKMIINIQPAIKENLFINLIMGRLKNQPEIFERLEFLGIDFSPANFIVIAMQIDGYGKFRDNYNEKERNLYIHRLLNMVEKIACRREKGSCVELTSDTIAAVINFAANINLIQAQEDSLKLATAIKDEVERNFPFTVTLGIGRLYKNITDVNLSYQEAVNALLYKLYQGKNEIIKIDDIEAQHEELYYYNSERAKLLLNHIKAGQREEVRAIINELFREIMENKNTSYQYLHQMFIRIISSIIELIINMGLTVEEVFGAGCNLYDELTSIETIPEIKTWFLEICHKVLDCVDKVNFKKSRQNINKILEYINDHLSQDISINDVASWIGFSPAYVGKMFKDNLGRNYLDYLNWSRIEKAKQLLKSTRLPVKEIGFKVGFNTIQTFMRTFKKYEGITPGQYRDSV
jgi:two-component system response regulator YesN